MRKLRLKRVSKKVKYLTNGGTRISAPQDLVLVSKCLSAMLYYPSSFSQVSATFTPGLLLYWKEVVQIEDTYSFLCFSSLRMHALGFFYSWSDSPPTNQHWKPILTFVIGFSTAYLGELDIIFFKVLLRWLIIYGSLRATWGGGVWFRVINSALFLKLQFDLVYDHFYAYSLL